MNTKLTLTIALFAPVFGALAFRCPSPNGIFSDPADCGSFYKCLNGNAGAFKCPSGLLFNAGAQVCDWAANVNCQNSKPNVQPSPTRRPNPPPRQPTASPSIPVNPSGKSSCNVRSSEPINAEVQKLRKISCMAPNSVVDKVRPGASSNPANVKVVESIFSQNDFKSTFPRADSKYTYENFLKAFAKFPEVCKTPTVCKKTLATMFAHFEQETAGLYYLKEINKGAYCATWNNWIVKAYPCISGQKYFGRGAKQLSWNYNYGAFSNAMFGDAQVLLKNPDLVSDTWLNFASALWFYATPQPPKPSMLAVVDGSWQPNSHDRSGNRLPGFGATIMIINGAQECGPSPPNTNGPRNRIEQYKKYARKFGVDISGEKLDCKDMQAFDGNGSANPALYWAPESGCTLAKWQSAYSALVEGDYQRCKNGN